MFRIIKSNLNPGILKVIAVFSFCGVFTISSAARAGTWLKVQIGIIGTSSEDLLSHAISEVKSAQHKGLIVQLDTPGGMLESTRKMISMMNVEFPIVVWVGPSGGRAASAGAFITLASHVASMAPGTNIGAAHPVEGSGKDVPQGDMRDKIVNDTVAFVEALAKKRNRNEEIARSFVISSFSMNAEDAYKEKVIDFIARDLPELLQKLDQKKIVYDSGKEEVLSTAEDSIKTYEPTFRQSLLEIISNPNLFYLLFMVGIIGLGYELTHPGVVFPGVVGGISMILALMAMAVLPVSFAAIALILFGVGLLVAEIFIPSFGILGIGGVVALVLGSVFLVDPKNQFGLRVSWFAILPGVAIISLASLVIGILVFRSTRSQVASGSEGMVGKEAIVIHDFKDGQGTVRIQGEIWQARLNLGDSIERAGSNPVTGQKVTVTGVNGLVLIVNS